MSATYNFTISPRISFTLTMDGSKLTAVDLNHDGAVRLKPLEGQTAERCFLSGVLDASILDGAQGDRQRAVEFLDALRAGNVFKAGLLAQDGTPQSMRARAPKPKYLRFEDIAELVDHNIITKSDSYKDSHFLQYPDGTKVMYSYIESRGGRYDKTLFFGAQLFVKRYLSRPITQRQIDYAAKQAEQHGTPFNKAGWEYILAKYDGYLPVTIKAVPEGTVIETKNVLVAIFNEDENLAWLTSWLETALLRAIWYPTTVATGSWHVKAIIKRFMEMTVDDDLIPVLLPSRLHDFGARAATSSESAAIGGLAHLVNFGGTDTKEALAFGEFYYDIAMAGQSIPAAEHSTITSWGREGETKAYANMLKQFARKGSFVAIVSDSYDIYNAVENIWGKTLKQQVIDSGATVIIRPDSGDPLVVPIKCLEILAKVFGTTKNSKGYMVINHGVRVIQGDGVDPNTIEMILGKLTMLGYSAENIAFGMGGKLLQSNIDRDTQKFAMKASAALVGDDWRDVFKDPITDQGKASKKGKFSVVWDERASVFKTVKEGAQGDILRTIFERCELVVDDDFDTIRARSEVRLPVWRDPKHLVTAA